VAVAALAAVSAVGGIVGCEQILGITSNRYLATDSGDDGGMNMPDTGTPDTGAHDTGMGMPDAPPVGPWDCIGTPPLNYMPGATTNVRLLAIDSLQPITQAEKVDGGSGLDILTYTPLPGLQIKACDSILDPLCNDSTSNMWMQQTSDDAGVTNFTLPQDFAGFFEINASTLFTTTFFPSPFVPGEPSSTLPGTFLLLSAVQGLESVLPGVTIDLDVDGGLGCVVLSVFDCHDHFAEGVYFVPSGVAPANSGYATTIFYTQGMGQQEFPTTSATATDKAGAGGILNVPAASFSIRVFLKGMNGVPDQQLGVLPIFIPPGRAAAVDFRMRTEHQ
jgi:hypothetical protein